MGKIEKSAGSVSIIGGSDGPTSVFIAGKRKKTLKQKWQGWCFRRRKERIARKIKPGTHTMDEVVSYVKEKYGFEEIAKDSGEYQRQHDELRASFIMQYEPQLLGEYATPPELKRHDEEALQEFFAELEMRQQMAKEIPDEKFAIDFHVLRKIENNTTMHIDLEARFGCISGGFSGPAKRGKKNGKREFDKMYKDIHLYYGVTEDDIVNETSRYKDLIRTLAMKG